MKTVCFIIGFVLYALSAAATVEMKSFYFKSNSCDLQADSKEALNELKQELREYKIQFIEFNAYTERSQFITNDKALAQKRIDFFLEELDAEDQQITLNAFGNQRIKLDFKPFNWERIDIYYTKEEKTNDAFANYTSVNNTNVNNFAPNETSKSDVKEGTTQNSTLNLHLNFMGGSAKILPSSEDNLDSLLFLMNDNPTLNANIRGHVCCGDQMRISKKRAKKVYKYLVSNGIQKERLSFEGLSNSEPLVYPEQTDDDRRLNRRVEVVFNGQTASDTLAEN